MKAPKTAAGVIDTESLQTLGVQVLGVALKYKPAAAAGKHYPAVFGKFAADVGCQQTVVSTVQAAPAYRSSQHGTATVGPQKSETALEQFGVGIYLLYCAMLEFWQQQKRRFCMLRVAGRIN